MINNTTQAFKKATQERRWQVFGISLMVFTVVILVATLYLSVSRRVAESGRRIQDLENQYVDLHQNINRLNVQLGELSSVRQMQERANNLKMSLLKPEESLYVELPGYQSSADLNLAPPADADTISSPIILPEYTRTLWDALLDILQANGVQQP